LEDKEVEMTFAAFGMVGLETALPLTITTLVDEGVLTLSQAIEKLSYSPAKALGLDRGTLKEGVPADTVIFNPSTEITIRASQFKSMGRNMPFDGWKLKGEVVATIAAGKFAHGELRTETVECGVASVK
jgi:dihydroorotase